MEKFVELLKLLYSRFLLRDLFSYLVPGLIVIYSFGVSIFFWNGKGSWEQNWLAFHTFLQKLTFLEYFLLYGLAYVVGQGIHCFSVTIRFTRYWPKEEETWGYDIAHERFIKRQVDFGRVATPGEKEQRERYVILKHLTVNNCCAFIIISVFLVIAMLSYSNSCWLSVFAFSFCFILVIIVLGLKAEHDQLVKRQQIYEKEVIQRGPADGGDGDQGTKQNG